MMSYFEKIGEGTHAPQHNSILGSPMLTLDRWLETRQAVSEIRAELVPA
jgi:hypothetical protein